MHRSTSAEAYEAKPRSALINYRGNISNLSLSINKTSEINEQHLISLACKSGNYHKLELLKRDFRKSPLKPKLDEILSNLEIINQARFLKNRISLQEDVKEKGSLDKNSSQYFEIKFNGSTNTLHINLETLKGSVEAFLSLSNCSPSRECFDKKFKGPELEVSGKFNQLMDGKCYVGVYAKQNSLIEIEFNFKKPKIDAEVSGGNVRRLKNRSQDYLRSIQEIQENHGLRYEFEQRVDRIKDQRKSNQTLDFIQLNKSLAATSASFTTQCSQFHKKYSQKREQVKKRKIVIHEERIKKLKNNLIKKEVKKQAEEQAREVHILQMKKEKLQKNWFVILNFSVVFTNWLDRLTKLKKSKVSAQLMRMKAYCIQKNFRLKFTKKNFTFAYRIKTLARNHLTLYSNSLIKASVHQFMRTFQKCVKEITTYKDLGRKFDTFHSRWDSVVYYWRLYKEKDRERQEKLLDQWAEVSSKVVKKLRGKGKKKKKSHAIDKINQALTNAKEKYIKDHLIHSKRMFVKQLRSGLQPKVLNCSIEEELLSRAIMAFAVPRMKGVMKATKS